MRKAGWRKPENTVNVTRPGKWCNPFTVAEYGRAEAVRLFIEAISNDDSVLRFSPDEISELRGKNLMCWCAPGDLCHGDVLLKLANSDE